MINPVARRSTQVWLKGAVLKTARGFTARGGSNPSSSAIHINIQRPFQYGKVFLCHFFKCTLVLSSPSEKRKAALAKLGWDLAKKIPDR